MNGNLDKKIKVLVFAKSYTTAKIIIETFKTIQAREFENTHFSLLFDHDKDYDSAKAALKNVDLFYLYNKFNPFGPANFSLELKAKWAKLYGRPNLTAFLVSERILQNKDQKKQFSYLYNHISQFEKLFSQIKPDIFITGPLDSLTPWVAFEVAKKFCQRVYTFSPARFGENLIITDNPYENLHLKARYEQLKKDGLTTKQKAAALQFRAGYHSKKIKPSYVVFEPRSRLSSFINFYKTVKEQILSDRAYRDYSLSATIKYFFARRIRLKLNQRIAKQNFTTNLDVPFFFFPLHYEPEASLLILGQHYRNQVEVIKLVAEALPVNIYLFVKEHPQMNEGMRPTSFFRALKQLPKVKLLPKNMPSDEILKKCLGVITIAGTAGWEALILGKPVMLFGHTFYREYEQVIKVNDWEKIPQQIEQMLSFAVDEDKLLCFITAVIERIKPGLLIEPSYFPQLKEVVLSASNINHFKNLLKEIIAESYK